MVKKGDKVQCDFGINLQENWKNCVVLSVSEYDGLFGGKQMSIHVKAEDGDTMEAIYWIDGHKKCNQ